MIVYEDNHVTVDARIDASLDIPVLITIYYNDKEYHYHLDGTTDDNCPYDADIKPWIKKARLELNELIWANKEHRQPNQITISTPLKLRMRFNKD